MKKIFISILLLFSFMFFKINALAETINFNFNTSSETNFSTSSKGYLVNNYSINDSLDVNLNYIFDYNKYITFYNSSTNSYIVHGVNLNSLSSDVRENVYSIYIDLSSDYQITFKDKDDNLISSRFAFGSGQSFLVSFNSSENTNNEILTYFNSVYTSVSNPFKSHSILVNNIYNLYAVGINNRIDTTGYVLSDFYNNYSNMGYEIIDSNFKQLYINDTKIDLSDNGIPSNYEIIDMDLNNAVLFWPKDFRKLNPDCEAKDALVGALANCLFNYDNIFYLVGRYAVAMTDLEMSFNAYQLDFTSTYYTEFTPFSIKTSIFKHQGIIFYSNPIDPLTGLYLTNMKIAYDPELFNYKIIHDLDEQESFDIEYTDENGEVKQTTIVGIPKQDSVPDGSNYKYEINENSFDNLDLVDYLNDFFSKIIKGLNFFKTQLLMFSNNIPSLVFSFIIVIPILLFIFLLMRWF